MATTSPQDHECCAAPRLQQRIVAIIGIAADSLATTCTASMGVVESPSAKTNFDSAGAAALAFTERPATRHGLQPFATDDWKECRTMDRFWLCGTVADHRRRIGLWEFGTTYFHGWTESPRHELLDSLRSQVGPSRLTLKKLHGARP